MDLEGSSAPYSYPSWWTLLNPQGGWSSHIVAFGCKLAGIDCSGLPLAKRWQKAAIYPTYETKSFLFWWLETLVFGDTGHRLTETSVFRGVASSVRAVLMACTWHIYFPSDGPSVGPTRGRSTVTVCNLPYSCTNAPPKRGTVLALVRVWLAQVLSPCPSA